MEITIISLAIFTAIGAACGILGFLLMRRKFMRQLELNQKKQEELTQRAYEMAVTREISDRIGYSLDATKIVEIISRSLGQLLSFSTVSNMILDKNEGKIRFECNVKDPVSPDFVKDVKTKMLAALSEMLQAPLVDADIDETIEGSILAENGQSEVKSFFNLPIVILGYVVGIINISSKEPGLYYGEDTEVLYRIAKQASEAVSKLRELIENEESRLSQAVESLRDGLLMVDTKYRLGLSNKRLSQLLSIVENPKIFDIVNALSGSLDLRTKMEEAIAKEEPLGAQEIVIRDKTFQVFVTRVMDRRNKPMGVVVIFHDITDAKSLERLRQDFMAMMVHELRSPLTSIKSTVELLQSDLSKISQEELKKYMVTIDSTSQSMLELVNDLLDVAKLEAGKFDVVSEAGDIEPVVLERIEVYKPIAQEKNIKISASIEKNLPDGMFDKIRIKQVFNNLLSNAVKYTKNGEITINVKKEVVNGNPIDILVSVKDTGIGIEPDQIEKLFSRFGQLEAGRNKAGLKSSGLGLYIAKKIIEASGGKIWVESQGADMGSTFLFTLPLAQTVVRETESGKSEGVVLVAGKVAQA